MSKIIRIPVLFAVFLALFGVSFAEEDHLAQAQKYFNEGKFSLAEVFYKKVVEKKPDHFESNYNLGKICYHGGRPGDSLKYLQTAYDLRPEKEILFLMANIMVEGGETQKGLSAYSNLMKEHPEYADVYLNAGLTGYKYLYNKQLTIDFWKRFLELKPEDEQSPKIRKALEYLSDPAFVLAPPSGRTNQGLSGSASSSSNAGSGGLFPDIKGKDIKSGSEEKYDLKKAKGITTE